MSKDERTQKPRRKSSSKSQIGKHQTLRGRQARKKYLGKSAGSSVSKDEEVVELHHHASSSREGQHDQRAKINVIFGWLGHRRLGLYHRAGRVANGALGASIQFEMSRLMDEVSWQCRRGFMVLEGADRKSVR